MPPPLRTSRVLFASALAAVGLLAVGVFDYAATRRDLLVLLRDQAQSLRQTIAAAARSNDVAGAQAERQVSERLLDNARLLAELDRRDALDQALLDRIAQQNKLFRVAASRRRERASDRRRVRAAAPGTVSGRVGEGRLEAFRCNGSGDAPEFVGQLHSARWGGGARVAAGVRRAGGGAILLNADATEIEALQKQVSLDSLLPRDGAAPRSLPMSRSIAAIFTSHTEHCQPPRGSGPGTTRCRQPSVKAR